MATLLLDYAWAKPSAATIKSAGYSGVMRYLSTDPTKNLTAAERDALLGAGLSIGLVWETYANRAGAGTAAGAADAKQAESQASALGLPAGLPIFYAVDYDADPNAVKPYFDGVRSATQRPVGIYGSLRVVDAALTGGWATYGWQTVAWSNNVVSTRAHLYQRLKATVPNPIPGSDENVVLRAFPLWSKTAPAPAPTPTPTPTPPRSPYTKDTVIAIQGLVEATRDGKWGNNTDQRVMTLRAGATGRPCDVRLLQSIVNVRVDGVFGPLTRTGVRLHVVAMQKILKVSADGVWGPNTDKAFITCRNQFLNKF